MISQLVQTTLTRLRKRRQVFSLAQVLRTLLIWAFFAYGVNASSELHGVLPIVIWATWGLTLVISLLKPKDDSGRA